MAFEVLEKRDDDESSRDYAYRLLRKSIMTLALKPGEVLNEGDLSEQLGMSRTPVHESLILLKNEGLVDILPQRGSKVSHISLTFVKEGFFMRQILETAIVKELAGSLSSEQMGLLRSNIDRQKELKSLETCNMEIISSFLNLDDQLHRMLYEFSYRQRIWNSVHTLNSHYDRVRYLDTLVNTVDLNYIYQQHERLYYYLLLGIPQDVDIQSFYKSHLGRFLADFPKTMAAHPEYFID